MARRALITEKEQFRLTQLMQRQPRSARALQRLLDRIQGRVAEAALKEPTVVRRLEGIRNRVLGVDLTLEKPEDGSETPVWLGEVGIYDYVNNVLVVPVLDLRSGRLVRLDERKGLEPPLTPEEFEEAQRIVLSDARYRGLAERPELEVVALPTHPTQAGFDPSHPALGHRCFTLYYWTTGESPEVAAEAIVDLSTQQLVPPGPARQHGSSGPSAA